MKPVNKQVVIYIGHPIIDMLWATGAVNARVVEPMNSHHKPNRDQSHLVYILLTLLKVMCWQLSITINGLFVFCVLICTNCLQNTVAFYTF